MESTAEFDFKTYRFIVNPQPNVLHCYVTIILGKRNYIYKITFGFLVLTDKHYVTTWRCLLPPYSLSLRSSCFTRHNTSPCYRTRRNSSHSATEPDKKRLHRLLQPARPRKSLSWHRFQFRRHNWNFHGQTLWHLRHFR